MKKIVLDVLIVIYFVVAIFVTILLLTFNEFKVSQIGDYSLILSGEDEMENIANKGDLVIVKECKTKDINKGDNIFFYMVDGTDATITAAKVTDKKDLNPITTSFTVEGEYTMLNKYVIGKVDGCTKVPYLGTILSILESKLVFLFLVVFPSFIVFLYEGYKVIMEVKYGKFEDL